MSDEESGGVQGLRVWAADAAERVKRLIPAMGAPAVPPGVYDASIAELDQLAPLLDHDPGLRSAVSVWRSGALALRRAAGCGGPADRERAEPLLRDVRDPGTQLGATATEEDRRWAALFLLTLISPLQPKRGGSGAAPDVSAFAAWVSQVGDAGMRSVAEEIGALTTEVVELPLPQPFLHQLRQMRGLFGPAPGPGPRPEPSAGSEPEPPADPGPERSPEPGPSPSPGPGPAPEPDPLQQSSPPFPPDDVRRFAAAMDAMNATTHGLDGVLKSDDPARALDTLLGRLHSVQERPPPGPDVAPVMEALRALLLNIGHGYGGTHQDRSEGRAHMGAIRSHFEKLAESPPPGVEDPAVVGRALDVYGRIMDARQAEDVPALRDLVDEAEALEEAVPEGHSFRFMALWALGAAYGGLGLLTGEKETVLRGLPYIEKGIAGAEESGLPFGDGIPRPYIPDVGLFRTGLTGDTSELSELSEHVPPPRDASTEDLHRSAVSLALRFSLTRDPAVLGTLIEESERVRAGVREGRAPGIAAEALWILAEAYRERGVLNEDVKDLSALEAAREALAALAADVLLQSGAEHGLLTARTGASRGVQAALWASSQGRPHEAVAALELGRGLVLHAASTTSDVPVLLEAGGHHELAEAWRAADAGRSPGTEESGVPGGLPSTLRRQALEALGYRRESGLLGTPTLAELADGVQESGADALIYLVPGGEGENPGVTIGVAPALGVKLSVVPLLSADGSGPLERYLDATAVYDTAAGESREGAPSAEQEWEEALSGLCEWAFQVLDPVLTEIAERLGAEGERGGGPLRVVLVPCGRLGIVPWHAARSPGETPHGHLCRNVVVSYAASGSQFLRTVKRARRDPAVAPVLLADPSMDLMHTEVEVLALRHAFYRQARMCGGIFEWPEEELAPGTPEDVLGFLADGVSLLHVASHGSAGTRPTLSALHLAAPEGTGGPGAAAHGRGVEPEPGMLTVTRILDRAEVQRNHDRAEVQRDHDRVEVQREPGNGPLVVLSACRTDLSTRDHDEALTLTTAFVSQGARDVVGSRWTTQDSASALLMAVFHHRLTVDGLSPVDALRAAQLWMLDPDRENPGSLSGELLRQMERPDLDRVALWAAFVHQGHPGPAGTASQGPGGTEQKRGKG